MQPDYESGMIDLGKEASVPMPISEDGKSSPAKTKIHYPSLYIQDVKELDDLPDGEFYFIAKGQVTRHTEETPIAGTTDDEADESEEEEENEDESTEDSDHCSCEITVMSMKPLDGMSKRPKKGKGGLGDTLDAMEKKKADDAEDAADEGADEESENT